MAEKCLHILLNCLPGSICRLVSGTMIRVTQWWGISIFINCCCCCCILSCLDTVCLLTWVDYLKTNNQPILWQFCTKVLKLLFLVFSGVLFWTYSTSPIGECLWTAGLGFLLHSWCEKWGTVGAEWGRVWEEVWAVQPLPRKFRLFKMWKWVFLHISALFWLMHKAIILQILGSQPPAKMLGALPM